ncbi:MAG: hypothetical protein ACP5TV_02035 [Anaerolineae bacterium]
MTKRLSSWSCALYVTAAAAVLLLVFLATPAAPLWLSSPQLLRNGSFEEGFSPDGTAVEWLAFDSGGGGWYIWEDAGRQGRSWQGKSAQRIQLLPAEEALVGGAQFAGICQAVTLAAGQTYILGLRGQLTAPSTERFDAPIRAQWGTAWGSNASWREVAVWHDIPWPAVQEEDGGHSWLPLETSFVTPAEAGLVCIRLWRRREFSQQPASLYLDDARLSPYRPGALDEEYLRPLQVSLGVPSFVTAGADTAVRVTAAGDGEIQALILYDDDRILAALDGRAGPVPQEARLIWRPEAVGRHYFRAEVWGAGGRAAWAGQETAVGEAAEFLAENARLLQDVQGNISYQLSAQRLRPGAYYTLNLAVRLSTDRPPRPSAPPCLVQYGWEWSGNAGAPLWHNMDIAPADEVGMGTFWRAVAQESAAAAARDVTIRLRALSADQEAGACRLSLESASLRGYR